MTFEDRLAELELTVAELKRRAGIVPQEQPPELPAQWKATEFRKPKVGEMYANRRGTIFGPNPVEHEHESFWIIVPAQPRPANYTDADGQEWAAGAWREMRGREDFFMIDKPGVNMLVKASPEEYNGWRWSAVKVAKPEPSSFKECAACAAKSGTPLLCESCLHNRLAIQLLTGQVRIAREEVVRELERWRERVGDAYWQDIVTEMDTRLAELRKDQP